MSIFFYNERGTILNFKKSQCQLLFITIEYTKLESRFYFPNVSEHRYQLSYSIFHSCHYIYTHKCHVSCYQVFGIKKTSNNTLPVPGMEYQDFTHCYHKNNETVNFPVKKKNKHKITVLLIKKVIIFISHYLE